MTVFALKTNGSNDAYLNDNNSHNDKNWEWHGLFAEMTRGCGLTSWETNSIVSHATANSPNGPWVRRGTVLDVWAHAPSAVVAADGTIALFHLGSGNTPNASLPGSREYNATCTKGRSPCGTHPVHHCNSSWSVSSHYEDRRQFSSSSNSNIINFHVADHPDGPWHKVNATIEDNRGLIPQAIANDDINADNFAFDTPFMHPNGTLYVVTAGRAILRADTWRGPYKVVTTGACGGGEDNYIYVDQRGSFHCLYHRSPFQDLNAQGGHAFSPDGLTWYTSETPAYPAHQQYADGTIGMYGKRERPHLIFDPLTGQPTHLTNGVCLNGNWAQCNNNPYPGYFDYTFTTVAPLQRDGFLDVEAIA